ncbi:MAG: isoaspartyl peptidase/L-asparaginase [Candidatus Binatia bacterium]|nr:MAG: isoaspartyl peptidase/L-asparaginase [Candidatus Binatia bacterium]
MGTMHRIACVVHGGAGSWPSAEHGRALDGCRAAIRASWDILRSGGHALRAVVAAVEAMENSGVFNAGVGSVLTENETVEMDAAVMDGRDLAAGAVAMVRSVRNPVRLAVEVLQAGREVMLAGEAADQWAERLGLETLAPAALAEAARKRRRRATSDIAGGTVGAVAVDAAGNVAAATSTGGRMGKRAGRIGDSPIIGAGTYADNRAGAASATGYGEAILRFGLARVVVMHLERGFSPARVAAAAIAELSRRMPGEAGVIVVDRFGRIGVAHNTEAMPVAWMTNDLMEPEATMSAERVPALRQSRKGTR